MSKDNHTNNLRLMGSPVNLSYRGKKKEDKKNIRNRPRSALQNSCFTPDIQERHNRPFSADAKEHIPSTRTFLKTFSVELLQSYNNSSNNVKVVAPTSELLGDTKSYEIKSENRDKELCSNASDHGSEDTFISLGTKIKARAQSPKQKNSNCKNFLKYRSIARKGKKAMEKNANESKPNNIYGLEIKITEKRDNSPLRNKNLYDERTPSPCFKTRTYDTFFQTADGEKKINEESLIGRVSFGSGAFHSEVEEAIDTYNRQLNLTKQQLSLVEEESTQDLESVPSHNLSSLSPENSLEELKNVKHMNRGDGKNEYPKMTRDIAPGPRTYNSFYDDFQTPTVLPHKLSSTIIANDTSSKDSGYTDSGGTNDEKCYRRGYSLPSKTSIFRNTNPHADLTQPKSLECIALSNDEDYLKTHPPDKKAFQFKEPLNHSRLLYKDFFLKKEGHIAVPPQNSPTKSDVKNIPGSSDSTNDLNPENEDRKDYPSYLLNSNTKAYTSKVIEDYKKEIAAINNLHELTLKDIKTDAISPTPLNIDKMFEQHSSLIDDKPDFNEISQESSSSAIPEVSSPSVDNTSSSASNKKDISKVSTKELIQNYLKVKEADYTKDYFPKNFKKFDKKVNNFASNVEDSMGYKQSWNNKNTSRIITSKSIASLPANTKTETHNSMPSKVPLSARIDGVENDKDIESWMSISAPSPIIYNIGDHTENPPSRNSSKNADNIPQITTTVESAAPTNTEKDKPKAKELSSDATVLDIYSMLKEIESFGDNPVPKAENTTPQPKEDDRANTPKDNFMEIFQFLEKVEQSANDALSVVTSTTPQTIPNLEVLLKLPQTELAQRLVTATLQLEERSCCIALLQESLTNHKEQMINKVSNLEKQSHRNIARVKQECEEAIKRHQSFIDQLINDKKTLNHRIEQLVDERRSLEERWRRSAQSLEERYKLELRNQHDKMAAAQQVSIEQLVDERRFLEERLRRSAQSLEERYKLELRNRHNKMAAAQQVARQRWVRQKAEKIKELTVKGLEGELREMAERQQKEIADIKMAHAEQMGRVSAKHSAELEELRREMEAERETALVKERQISSSRLEKQILELELTYQEQRTRLVAEMRAENERVASGLCEKERNQRREIEQWRENQEKLLEGKRAKINEEIAKEKEKLEEEMKQKRTQLEQEFESYKKEFESDQLASQKRKVTEIAAQHKLERDRAIEKAIESMEAEAQQGRRELQEALRRNKEQYEAELRELAETEQATLKRYQDTQARVRQTEDRCAELEVTINQLQTRNKVLTEKTIQLDNQAEEIRSHCTMAWKEKVESLQKEIEDTRRTHDEQMHQLYAKVKVAVARKDSAIQALNREAAKYQEKITLLEQKLQQQRKDFLNNKK